MSKKKADKYTITELFMAKAGWERCFYGTIHRSNDENGKPFVYSKIIINDSYICARASTDDKLGANLDEIVIMVLDKGLHLHTGISIKIWDTDFFLN